MSAPVYRCPFTGEVVETNAAGCIPDGCPSHCDLGDLAAAAATRAEIERPWREAVADVLDWGVVQDDVRLDYLDVQVDRKAALRLRALLDDKAAG